MAVGTKGGGERNEARMERVRETDGKAAGDQKGIVKSER